MTERQDGSSRRGAPSFNRDLAFDKVASPNARQMQSPGSILLFQKPKSRVATQNESICSSSVNSGAANRNFEKNLPHATRGKRLQTSEVMSSYYAADVSAVSPPEAHRLPVETTSKIKVVNQASLGRKQAQLLNNPQIWFQSNVATGQNFNLKTQSLVNVTTFTNSSQVTKQAQVEQSSQFRLKYEHMPPADSEIDSARHTVDLAQEGRPRIHQSTVADGPRDDHSEATIGTIMEVQDTMAGLLNTPRLGSEMKERGNSTSLVKRRDQLQQSEIMEESSVMTQFVAVSEHFVRQVHRPKDAVIMQLVYEPVPLPTDSEWLAQTEDCNMEILESDFHQIRAGPTMLRQNQHHQSQSLEHLPSFKELVVDGENKNGQLRTLQKSECEAASDFGEITLHQESCFSRIDRANMRLSSECVETKEIMQGSTLKVSRDPIEPSDTVQQYFDELDGTALHDSDKKTESVTDTITVAKRTFQAPPVPQTKQTLTLEQVSETERAHSIRDSINATRSDRVELGTFEEENSVDWKRQQHQQSCESSVAERRPASDLENEKAKSQAKAFDWERSQPSSHGKVSENEGFYESFDESACQQSAQDQDLCNAFLDQEFNRISDARGVAQSQEETVEEHAQGMIAIEENSPWVNHDVAPNFDDSVMTDHYPSHQRVVKSFDLSQRLAQPAKDEVPSSGRGVKESGVEQYESDEGDALREFYSSVQQTSVTIDWPLQPAPKHRNQASGIGSSERQTDSMAFETMAQQKSAALAFTYEREGNDDQGLIAQGMDVVAQDCEEDKNVAISIMHESEKDQDRSFPNNRSSLRSAEELERTCASECVELPLDNPDLQECIEVNSVVILDDKITTGEPFSRKRFRRKARHSCDKKSSLSKKKKSQSPRNNNSQGRRQQKQSSQSPKFIIKNGKVALAQTVSREGALEKYQFPIRKKKYDQRAVEQMLVTRGHMAESERMMTMMKKRILNYNSDIVPYAQQYYYAMKQNPSLGDEAVNLSSDFKGTFDGHLDKDQSASFTPVAADLEQISLHLATSPTEPSRRAGADLPLFLSGVSKPQTSDAAWFVSGINNIQVLNSRSFPHAKQMDSAVLPQSLQKETPQSNVPPLMTLELLGPYIDDLRAPATGAKLNVYPGVLLDTPEGQFVKCPPADYRRKMESQVGDLIRLDTSPTRSKSPIMQSEARFRVSKRNQRLILAENSTPTSTQRRGEQRNICLVRSGAPKSVKECTRQTFYPQDNLSSLLHAQHSLNTRLSANLAQKLAQNRISTTVNQRSLTKNKTIGKIYNKSNARNLIVALGAPQNCKVQPMLSVPGSPSPRRMFLNLHPKSDLEANYALPAVDTTDPPQNSKERVLCEASKICKTEHGSQKSLLRNATASLPVERNVATLQTSARYIDSQVQDSQRPLFKQRTEPQPKGQGSVMEKFQRWLDKGRPMQNATSNLIQSSMQPQLQAGLKFQHEPRYENQIPLRRRIGEKVLISARGSTEPASGMINRTPVQDRVSEKTWDFFEVASDRKIESIERHKGKDPAPEEQSNRRMSDLLALQMMKNPAFGKLLQMQSQQKAKRDGITEEPNTLFRSKENDSVSKAVNFQHFARTGRKGPEHTIYVQVCRGDSPDRLAQTNARMLAQRKSQQQETYKEYGEASLEAIVPFLNSKLTSLNNLSSIYAVPQGKKRQLFLKDNYTKNSRLFEAHNNRNSRLIEQRKSRSPRRSSSPLERNGQRGSSKRNYFNKQTTSLAFRQGSVLESLRGSADRPASKQTLQRRHSAKNASKQGIVPKSKTASQMRQQQGPVEPVDAYEHPQISLSLPVGGEREDLNVEVIRVDDDAADGDHNCLQILTEQDSYDARTASDIDQLQEREICEEEHSQDVPQVLAEDDANPNHLSDLQDDPILGEQSISEDESGEVKQVEATMRIQKSERYNLPQDSERQARELHNHHARLAESTHMHVVENGASRRQVREEDGERELSHSVAEENYEDEDYYADDKFVYDDVAEDPSSDDPEQKFLKEHAVKSQSIEKMKELMTHADQTQRETNFDSLKQTVQQMRRKTSQSCIHEGRASALESSEPDSYQDDYEESGPGENYQNDDSSDS